MYMIDTLFDILEENTALVRDKDLFYLEIPLDKHGVWLADAQVDSRFNGTGRQEFDMYVRFKTKTSGMANIKYLKNTIDALSGSGGICKLADGTTFKLGLMYQFEYLEK